MKTSLTTSDATLRSLERLKDANRACTRHYPGESERRQPVHTVYGGAHLFSAGTAARIGQVASAILSEYAPSFVAFARALGLRGADSLPVSLDAIAALGTQLAASKTVVGDGDDPAALAFAVHRRVSEKLEREAVEDFRIDFEDGYGNRPDAEEDGHAEKAAEEVAKGLAERTLPPFIGIRIKPFTEELAARSLRTLDVFITTLAARTGNRLPDNFVVTFPKVTVPEQVLALVDVLKVIEERTGLPDGSIRIELMVETTQSLIGPRGEIALPALIAAAAGRCTGAHFGTYDYTACCNITAAHQHMAHPACDFARSMMQVALAGTGIWLSDGATNVMPVGPHRAGKEGPPLSFAQLEENRDVVHRAWRLNYGHVQSSLRNALYQGWDLHPAQLPVRYAAVYSFFFEGLSSASIRLKAFMDKAAQATLVGDVFDDAATGQGLLNYFLRAQNCGAITTGEATRLSGLSLEELRCRSFAKILAGRRR